MKTNLLGILKKKRSQRRVVSAAGNRGIIAASIRDSLEISKKSVDEEPVEVRRNVVWDKLYYDVRKRMLITLITFSGQHDR